MFCVSGQVNVNKQDRNVGKEWRTQYIAVKIHGLFFSQVVWLTLISSLLSSWERVLENWKMSTEGWAWLERWNVCLQGMVQKESLQSQDMWEVRRRKRGFPFVLPKQEQKGFKLVEKSKPKSISSHSCEPVKCLTTGCCSAKTQVNNNQSSWMRNTLWCFYY